MNTLGSLVAVSSRSPRVHGVDVNFALLFLIGGIWCPVFALFLDDDYLHPIDGTTFLSYDWLLSSQHSPSTYNSLHWTSSEGIVVSEQILIGNRPMYLLIWCTWFLSCLVGFFSNKLIAYVYVLRMTLISIIQCNYYCTLVVLVHNTFRWIADTNLW